MRAPWACAVAVALSGLLGSQAAETTASPTFEIEGHSYDFRALCGQTLSASSDLYAYKVNICGGNAENCAGPSCQFKDGMLEAVTSRNQAAGKGVWRKLDLGEGFKLVSNNGDPCFSMSTPRVTTIEFPCDPKAGVGAENFRVKDDVGPSCAGDGYKFEMRTACSCASGCRSTSMLRRAAVLAPLLFMVYVAAGCFYNHKAHATALGLESFPNKDFWQTVPGRAKVAAAAAQVKLQGWQAEREAAKAREQAGLPGSPDDLESKGLLDEETGDL